MKYLILSCLIFLLITGCSHPVHIVPGDKDPVSPGKNGLVQDGTKTASSGRDDESIHECDDPDKMDYYVKGTARGIYSKTDEYANMTDECRDGNTKNTVYSCAGKTNCQLIEYYCNHQDKVAVTMKNCPCKDGKCPMTCGDNRCSNDETCMDCPKDCGDCSTCPDSRCDPAETCLTCPEDCGVCEKAKYAITGGRNGIRIFNVTDPYSPWLIGKYIDEDIVIWDINLDQEMLYAGSNNYFQVFNISDLSFPELIYQKELGFQSREIDIQGGYAFLTDNSDGSLKILDLEDMEISGSFDSCNNAFGIELNEDIAFITCNGPGGDLKSIDISDKENPVLISEAGSFGTSPMGIGLTEDIAMTVSLDGYINMYNISGKGDQTKGKYAGLGHYDFNDIGHDIDIVNNLGFVASDSGLLIISICPTLEKRSDFSSSVETPGFASKIDVVGQYAYVADGWKGLQVIDISDPLNPGLISGYDFDNALTITTIS